MYALKLVSIRQLLVLAVLAIAAFGIFIAVKAGATALIYNHILIYMLSDLAVTRAAIVMYDQFDKRMDRWPVWCRAGRGVAIVLIMFTIVMKASILFAPQLFANGFTLLDPFLALFSGLLIVLFVQTVCRFILR